MSRNLICCRLQVHKLIWRRLYHPSMVNYQTYSVIENKPLLIRSP